MEDYRFQRNAGPNRISDFLSGGEFCDGVLSNRLIKPRLIFEERPRTDGRPRTAWGGSKAIWSGWLCFRRLLRPVASRDAFLNWRKSGNAIYDGKRPSEAIGVAAAPQFRQQAGAI